jgi:UDPglucose--hexose-1-phosphate uridylyltransferase
MLEFNMEEHPHRRFNALTGDWVLVSPHRAKRPWQGQVEKGQQAQRPQYDEKCYLCPGNERIGGEHNPQYTGTYVFTNDFSALLTDTPMGKDGDGELFRAESEQGICKVICFSPRHDLTIPEMTQEAVRGVVDVWQKEYIELGHHDFVNYVQIFENKGAVMGCSNPHPHGQIWSSRSIPVEPMKEQVRQLAYFQKHKRTLLGDYQKKELEKKDRLIYQNDNFVVLSPYWAVWPFEAMIVSKRAVADLSQFTDAEKEGLADAYRQLTIRYDNLFEVSFPYSAGIHQAPTDGNDHPEWHFHMHFYPPLLRSATVKKFMVGYEMLATPQRDITPETSASRLRALSDIHFKNRDK